MEYRFFGKTDLKTSALGFGLWPIGGVTSHGYGTVEDDQAIAAIRRALDLGITLFDTAPAYGNGRGERILAEALGPRRKDAIIVTKCGVPWSEEQQRWLRNSSYEEITTSAENSLRALSTDYIDLLLIHWPDIGRPPEIPMRAFEDLRKAGKIRHAGVSNFSTEQIRAYLKYGPLVAQQVGYHMFDRRMEPEMLPFCLEQGIGVMAYGSLAHGLLTGTFTADTKFGPKDWRGSGYAFGLPIFKGENLAKNVAVVERLKAFAQGLGWTMPQLALAWVLRQPAISVALTGARKPDEIEDNARATEHQLTAQETAAIEEILKDAAGTVPDKRP